MIREAKAEDVQVVYDLIVELAIYEKEDRKSTRLNSSH